MLVHGNRHGIVLGVVAAARSVMWALSLVWIAHDAAATPQDNTIVSFMENKTHCLVGQEEV
jgi:hypothetical protein